MTRLASLQARRLARWTRALPFALLLAGTPALAQRLTTDNITGSLPRGDNPSTFDMTIKVIEVPQERVTAAEQNGETPFSWLGIKLGGAGAADEAQKDRNCPETSPDYYIEERADTDREQDSDGRWQFTYKIRVGECPGKSTALDNFLKGQTELLVTVYFRIGDAEIDISKSLKKSLFIVTEQPTFSTNAAVGSQGRVVVYWNVPADKIAIKGSGDAGTSTDPTTMTVAAIPADLTLSTIPAKKFDPNQATDPDAAAGCDFTAQSGDCVSCEGTDVYPNPSALANQDGIKVTQAQVSAGSAVITGLVNDQDYLVFLQYEPGGPASRCIVARPTPNFSLTELNGAGDAEVVNVRCFIATAAYGSPLDERLGLFRRFRDEVLVKSALGRLLVETYYEISPPLADFIAEREWLRALTRAALEPLAWLLELWDGSREPA